jgi:2-methylisocitrate lyase-like PEP mutase family enzyme
VPAPTDDPLGTDLVLPAPTTGTVDSFYPRQAGDVTGHGPGHRLRTRLSEPTTLPAIGVYDVFSAGIAAKEFDALFVSGFSFAASYYGLPDEGFLTWSDIVDFVRRVRGIAPEHHLVVDIDDGYGDDQVAAYVARTLESAGASGVVMEDQRRPRRCGHLDGKLLLDLDDYLRRLDRVLSAREDLVVVARTDACDIDDIWRRANAFVDAGADAVLVDGISDAGLLHDLARSLDRPLVFNQLAGGKSPQASLAELGAAQVSMTFFSTVCLFAAQEAVGEAVQKLNANGGLLADVGTAADLSTCQPMLSENLAVTFANP